MSTKRRAAPAANGGDEGNAKKRKLDSPEEETPEGVTKEGLKLIGMLKETRDKKQHLIAESFMSLPTKKELPNYYAVITLPMSIEIIERKLNRHEYPTVTTLESDIKRMITNAKRYNERDSDIFNDAEKIRKYITKHMERINPAYKNPEYQAFPTPVPGEDAPTPRKSIASQAKPEKEEDEIVVEEQKVPKPRRSVTLHGPKAPEKEKLAKEVSAQSAKPTKEITPVNADIEKESKGFEGLSFQAAQEKIIEDMMTIVDDEGIDVAPVFHNLPSRALKDYYSAIKHPVSLKSVQKLIKGIRGREDPTGVSFFKSWQRLEDEIAYIWENARFYNEDGTDIHNAAGVVEKRFNVLLAAAKSKVPEPQLTRVKLRMGAKSPEPQPKIMLRIGQKGETANGVSVDEDAIKRQQDFVRAGANGIATKETPARSSATPAPLAVAATRAESTKPLPLGDSTNTAQTPVPAADAFVRASSEASPSQPRTGTSMPPPTGIPSHLGGTSPATAHVPAPPLAEPYNCLESKWRLPGSDVSDAMITNLRLFTSLDLLPSPREFNFPPHPKLSQRSVTVTLPPTAHTLTLSPTYNPRVINKMNWRAFCLVNGQKVEKGTRTGQFDYEIKCTVPDAKGASAVTRVDFEVLFKSSQKVEFEKTTIFVHLT